MRAPPIPEEAIINASISVVQWVTEDGEMAYGVSYEGGVPLSQYMGLFQVGMSLLWEESKDW